MTEFRAHWSEGEAWKWQTIGMCKEDYPWGAGGWTGWNRATTSALSPGTNARGRPVTRMDYHVVSEFSGERERVLNAAREKYRHKDIIWRGCKLYLFSPTWLKNRWRRGESVTMSEVCYSNLMCISLVPTPRKSTSRGGGKDWSSQITERQQTFLTRRHDVNHPMLPEF